MISEMDYFAAKAALEWQIALGVDECMSEAPINRFEVKPSKMKFGKSSNIAPVAIDAIVQVLQQAAPDIAAKMAAQAGSVTALRDAIAVFEHCALKKGAKNLVFADGNPAARVMIITDAPDREEDAIGTPFVGIAGQLLDKMFGAINLARDADAKDAIYIANVMPWRPPQSRDPSAAEIEMMMPFVKRHVELVNPDVLILMGNVACQALLGRQGITRLRGKWAQALGKPVMPMFTPAALLRDGAKKRDTWADLLEVQARLRGAS